MSTLAPHGSSTLLLFRLSSYPDDAKAWNELVLRYGGLIYNWCRRYGLQRMDAEDVTQNVFAKLLCGLQRFDRSISRFRTWLRTVVVNAVRDWCGKPAHLQVKGTEDVRQLLGSEEARRDLEFRLGEEFDLELLGIAEQRVRLRVEPRVWSSYELFCKEQLNLKQAGGQIGIKPGHVSKNAQRVRDMIAREIVLLDDLGET